MLINYSKPSDDIKKEGNRRKSYDSELFKLQQNESKRLLSFRDRQRCILCGHRLSGENFMHREIPFVLCGTCGHVQTRALPPDDYPKISFSSVYPASDSEAYNDRKRRIYKPKLEWILNCLKDLSFSKAKILDLNWTEMGSGAGYFISCLMNKGIENVIGFDSDERLVEIANEFIPGNRVSYYNKMLSDSFDQFQADIYVAFFVLEHINDIYRFIRKLRQRPKDTIFIFSVPVFGFSCLLENIFNTNYARNLDAVLHTQLYTDTSIEYMMEESGYEILAEWIFGQDAMDFTRFILNNLSEKLSKIMLKKIDNDFIRLQDSIQHSLDILRLSDQRHLITIKK